MNTFFRYKLDHILFWAFTILFHAFTRLDILKTAGAGQFFLEVVIRNALLACTVYFVLLVVIPRLIDGRKVFASIVLLVAAILFYVLLKDLHDKFLTLSVDEGEAAPGFLKNSYYNLSIVLFYLAFATGIYLSKQWFLQREHIRRIELEKLNTELDYLKAQINPHFLFNSLNTVFFQIDKKNVQARETLSIFSEMLRYQLYECNGKEISIEKEIRYLKNYVDLQRMRKDENYSIVFSGNGELTDFRVPPLLMIPFIENAFKHISNYTDRSNEVRITVIKNDGVFKLSVFNTKEMKEYNENGGIGLRNVKRRLELLYKDRYQLDISDKADSFEINLELLIDN